MDAGLSPSSVAHVAAGVARYEPSPVAPLPIDATMLRLRLLQNGWTPIPVKAPDHPDPKGAGKAPTLPDWQKVTAAALTPDVVRSWSQRHRETNTGLICGHLAVVDIDVPVAELAERLKEVAFALLGRTPFIRIGRSPKLALCYRAAAPVRKLLTHELFLPDGTKLQVEILGEGQQVVAYGIHPDTRQPYSWPEAAPHTHSFAEVPEVQPEALTAFLSAAEAILVAAGATLRGKPRAEPRRAARPGAEKGKIAVALAHHPKPTRAEVEEALRAVPNTHDWHGWVKIGGAIFDALGIDGEDLFTAWSAQSSKDDPEATRSKWASFSTSPMTDVTSASLFWEARQNGWRPVAEREPVLLGQVNRADAADAAPGLSNAVELTEHGVALAFARKHRDELHYCHTAGAWFVWKGTHWAKNETRLAFAEARALAAALSDGAEFKIRAAARRATFAGAVERFAQADPTFAVTVAAWDRDPWLLGTPGGTVDLRTGVMRTAQRRDMITRVTAVAPAAQAVCPLWLSFLQQATGGDDALIGFLQRWCGYCLTGTTREHALLFIFGHGGNGKSVFLNVVSGILGAYHATAAMDTFTDSGGSRHLAFLAMLAGARMVTAAETEEGRPWAETKIKEMTGGTAVTANFMRQNPFTYVPQFKITITGNHKPVLRTVDDAARRRFDIVPFLHKPARPDRELETKLCAEWPGILQWMIDGCLDWQRIGLARPAIVAETTADYFAAQDVFGLWKAERCIVDPQLMERPSRLLNDLNAWLNGNGEQPTNRNRFRAWAEKEPALRYKTVNGSDFVSGIGLRPSEGAQGGDGWRR